MKSLEKPKCDRQEHAQGKQEGCGDGVVQQDSVARRVDGPAAPACGVDEVVPEDLAVPELTREGRDVGASERSDQARRIEILDYLEVAA